MDHAGPERLRGPDGSQPIRPAATSPGGNRSGGGGAGAFWREQKKHKGQEQAPRRRSTRRLFRSFRGVRRLGVADTYRGTSEDYEQDDPSNATDPWRQRGQKPTGEHFDRRG